MNSRRHFLFKLALTAGAPLTLASRLGAQAPAAPEKQTETDPVAAALGYKEDTTKVDPAKFPQHTKEQRCEACSLYTGKPGEASGPCSAFGGKLVMAGGWCAAYAKKVEAAG